MIVYKSRRFAVRRYQYQSGIVSKKRKRVDINVKSSQEPQSKKAFVDTGPDINALIDGSGIVLD